MTTVRRSLFYSIADSYLALPLQLISTMVIARLLTPTETGIFAVAAVFTTLASTFRDFGVAEYLIQEKDLQPEHLRASFTVNIAISWLMAFLVFLGAPWIADFYGHQGIAEVMNVQACNLLLIPFGAVTMAYFRRQLDFRPIFLVNLASSLTSFVVATTAALLGNGYMSLAWSSLAGVTVSVGLSMWLRPANFPRWPGLHGVRRVLHFGKFVSGIYIIGQVSRGAPEAIIGRASGLVEAALFSRGYGLVELFNRAVLKGIAPVCLPYFAQRQREEGSVVNGYLIAVSYLTAVGWPFLTFLIIAAYPAIRLVYGPQWVQCVPLSEILCSAALVGLIHCLASELLLATGDARGSNRLQFITQCIRILALFCVIPFGLTGVCWALLLATLVNATISQITLAKSIGLTVPALGAACSSSLLVAVISVLPTLLWLLIDGISEDNYLSFGMGGGLLTVCTWILALRYSRHPLWFEVNKLLQGVATRIKRSVQ